MTLRWLHGALSENRMCHISHKERSHSSGLEATTVCFQRDAATHYFVHAPNILLSTFTLEVHAAPCTRSLRRQQEQERLPWAGKGT